LRSINIRIGANSYRYTSYCITVSQNINVKTRFFFLSPLRLCDYYCYFMLSSRVRNKRLTSNPHNDKCARTIYREDDKCAGAKINYAIVINASPTTGTFSSFYYYYYYQLKNSTEWLSTCALWPRISIIVCIRYRTTFSVGDHHCRVMYSIARNMYNKNTQDSRLLLYHIV